MAGLQDIRRRIRSVKNTQQVTKAMKMISAVKLRKSQERLLALRPYAGKILDVVNSVVLHLGAGSQLPESPLVKAFLAPRDEKRIRVVLVASDRGFCGGFNSSLFKTTEPFLWDNRDEITQLDVIGKRASDWAKKNRISVEEEHIGIPLTGLRELASQIASETTRQFRDNEIDALYVIYNRFVSAVSQTPTITRIFPMESGLATAGHRDVPHLLEPDPVTVLEALLPQYIETEISRCLLESAASEHGARMSAMDKSSTNAAEMIDKLTLHMNKIRQAAITNQIIEIVSGANA